jgi:hypothetical protein
MFVGHFGVGLAGKAVAPRVSLAVWFVAVQLVDLLWPVFLLLGWEHVRIAPGITRLTPLDFYDYPITHSLLGGIGWAVLFGLLAWVLLGRRRAATGRAAGGATSARGRRRVSLLLAAGVLSHWPLDVLVHRRDMPVLPRGPDLGLGLWNHPALELAVEGALYLGGAALYLRATRPADRIGRYGCWLLLAFLPAAWLSTVFGPPPPAVPSLAGFALAGSALTVLWAWWVDRHRLPREVAVAL